MESFDSAEKFLDNLSDVAAEWAEAEQEMSSLRKNFADLLNESVKVFHSPLLTNSVVVLGSILEDMNAADLRNSASIAKFLHSCSLPAGRDSDLIRGLYGEMNDLESRIYIASRKSAIGSSMLAAEIARPREMLLERRESLLASLLSAEQTLERTFTWELAQLVQRQAELLSEESDIIQQSLG